MMMKKATCGFMLVIGLALFGSGRAGELEPPGPPASTMVTLQEIYDKLDACSGGGLCGVAKTGQTGCWDASGNPISCTGTGQDGEYKAGGSADPRFTVNGDGTVTDNLTGLIWLQNADCFGLRAWTDALADANTLADPACGLTDGSAPGDWRLPNIRELHSLVDYSQVDPALPSGHPFFGVQFDNYSSSTTWATASAGSVWVVFVRYGSIGAGPKSETEYVWPVRGGL